MRVIIADDSRPTRDVLRRILRDGGHDVVGIATNGKESIDLCRVHKPDALLTDLTMPQMTGNEALEVILSERLAGKVVVISSNKYARSSVEALGCGFILKPWTDDNEILRAIQP